MPRKDPCPYRDPRIRAEWDAHRKRMTERYAGKRPMLGQPRTPVTGSLTGFARSGGGKVGRKEGGA